MITPTLQNQYLLHLCRQSATLITQGLFLEELRDAMDFYPIYKKSLIITQFLCPL